MKNSKKKNIRIKIKSILKIIKKIGGFLFKFIKLLLKISIIIFIIVGFAWWSSQEPSLNRDWVETEKILADIDFLAENKVKIKNVRNFKHISKKDFIPGYYDETYDLDKINSLYYIVEPFGEFRGAAHTMLSFGFEDGKYVVISGEIRKEKGEYFDPFLGLLNQYEIVYIIGDENDLIKLRTNIKKDDVMLYPIKIEKEKIKQIFLSALHRADKLSKEPEFYNTLWNTCATSILKHVNSVIDNEKEKIKFGDYKILFPGYSDIIPFERKWIETDLSFKDAQNYFNITKIAQKIKDNKIFSKEIRKFNNKNFDKIK